MTTHKKLSRGIRQLKQAIQEVAATADREDDGSISVSHRSNVVIAGTTGGENSVHQATAQQSAEIHQVNGKTVSAEPVED